MNAFNLALIMFLLILVGYISRKSKFVDEKFGSSLSAFIFNVVFPAIIISSMSIPFKKEDMNNSLILIIISTATMAVMFIVGISANNLSGKQDGLSRIITFAMMFPNFTFMAFPVMETLFPEKGLFYISMYTIPTRFFIYILGPMLMRGGDKSLSRKQILKEGLKSLVTPPVIAIPIGFFLYFTGIQLPFPIQQTMVHLAKVATPMGMALSGIMLAEASIGSMLKEKRLYLLTVLRLIAAPVIIYLLLLPFTLDPVVLKISVLYCALPIASSTTVFALTFGGDAKNAAGGVFLTTIISIITIPICAYILELVV